jgi:hypothetical protein
MPPRDPRNASTLLHAQRLLHAADALQNEDLNRQGLVIGDTRPMRRANGSTETLLEVHIIKFILLIYQPMMHR